MRRAGAVTEGPHTVPWGPGVQGESGGAAERHADSPRGLLVPKMDHRTESHASDQDQVLMFFCLTKNRKALLCVWFSLLHWKGHL